MTQVFRFVAMCAIGVALATFSIASAQTYTTIDFPGAVTTTLNGGPNPQGTSVGTYTDTSNVIRGFTLTKKDVFTSFDPPGSTGTTPNFISPQGVIVGGYLDSALIFPGRFSRLPEGITPRATSSEKKSTLQTSLTHFC